MAEPTPGARHAAGSNPFSTLAVWRDKVAADLQEPPLTTEYKLNILLEQGRDCEQAVWGCLKDSLSELHEGQEWGLLTADFARAQHMRLYELAAQEVQGAKQMCLQLAHEHGVAKAYSHMVKQGLHHSVGEYDSVGQLRFALLVWRTDLQRDLSLASNAADVERLLREGCRTAAKLIRRCTQNSSAFWSAQQAHGAPAAPQRRTVFDAAWAKARGALADIAEQHHIAKEVVEGAVEREAGPDA